MRQLLGLRMVGSRLEHLLLHSITLQLSIRLSIFYLDHELHGVGTLSYYKAEEK